MKTMMVSPIGTALMIPSDPRFTTRTIEVAVSTSLPWTKKLGKKYTFVYADTALQGHQWLTAPARLNSLPRTKKINGEMHICLGSLIARSKLSTHNNGDFLTMTQLRGVEPSSLTMAMNKETAPPPNPHGRNNVRTPTHVFPGGRKTLALMLTTGLFVFLLSTYHPAALYHSPMATHISPQETKIGAPLLTSIHLSALSSWCKIAWNVTFWTDFEYL